MVRCNLTQVQFTNRADQVQSDSGIINPACSVVNTLRGRDEIIGTQTVNGNFGFGVLAGLGAVNFYSAIASAQFRSQATIATDGIKNEGIITTNGGRDLIKGNATANLSATATTISQAIAIAEIANTSVIAQALTSIELKATADGIDNTRGKIHTNEGGDTIEATTEGSLVAIARAIADVSAMVPGIAEIPASENLTAFAGAIAQSLIQAEIATKGINNQEGIITTGTGNDVITANVASNIATFSQTAAFVLSLALPENEVLAQAVAEVEADAVAEASDEAIAIDNTRGMIHMAQGRDAIQAIAEASNRAIAIDNSHGLIWMGSGRDHIIAKAIGSDAYGIYGGDIVTGSGADTVIASSFGGGVNINLGRGNDFIEGFGDAVLNGGKGFDTLSFGTYQKSNFQISLGTSQDDLLFELDGIAMETSGFENYMFADGNYHHDLLLA
jgi:hypothetical protein